MIVVIQRKSDNKYLQSAENDSWTDSLTEAFEMNAVEYKGAKDILNSLYQEGDLKEIINFLKSKPTGKEDRKIIQNLLKK